MTVSITREIEHAATKRTPPIPITCQVFPDGTIIEAVRVAAGGERLRLLKWNDGNATLALCVRHAGQTFVPAAVDPSVLEVIRFPVTTAPHSTTRDLFCDLGKLLAQYTDLPEQFVSLAAYFTFATWMIDRLTLAPCLSIVAGLPGESMPLLRLLRCVCRRPLLVGGLNPATLRSLPMYLHPTLLIAGDLDFSTQRLLWAASNRGVCIPHKGQLLDFFCARAIASGQRLSQAGLDGTAIHLAVGPTCRTLPTLEGEEEERIANHFQDRMFSYRLSKYNKISSPPSDLTGLASPTQPLARSLQTGIVGDAELQSDVASWLRNQDEETRAERSAALESVLLEASLFFCHDPKRQEVYVGELTYTVNTILKNRGETAELEPREVGHRLRCLGLFTKRLSGAGRGITLLQPDRQRIHRLAYDFEVPSVRDGIARCGDCVQRQETTQ